MKRTRILTGFVLSSLLLCLVNSLEGAPLGTAFTYQGRLMDANNAADGSYDFQLKLFDDPAAGNQKGSTISIGEEVVIDGYFTLQLDFGGGVFDGNERWLEIGVRSGNLSDPNGYTILSPRQQLTATPYAHYAKTAGNGNIDLPSGVIVMWSGATIPAGWALCNGANGTPDLRDRFVVGAGNEYSVGNTGGEKTHTLTVGEMPSHTHTGRFADQRDDSDGDDTTYYVNKGGTGVSGVTGGDQPHENRPPYYALAYIMKL